MKTLTTDELAQELAGGDSYIRTKNNIVKGLAITTNLNPEAPEIIVVGKGKKIVSNAMLFVKQQQYVPVYVKQTVNSWKYLGEFKADKYTRDVDIIEKHRKNRLASDVDGVLFLSPRDQLDIKISSPKFPNSETRRKIELAAVDFVTTYYKQLGYSITDHQKDNCGYDLFIENHKEIFKIEVKGTSSEEQRFFLSRNERAKSVDPLWRLAIVTNVLTNPELLVLNAKQMEDMFSFDALCWECITK